MGIWAPANFVVVVFLGIYSKMNYDQNIVSACVHCPTISDILLKVSLVMISMSS